jgi:GntR family transcriptional regulator / MocR family aminotransferase
MILFWSKVDTGQFRQKCNHRQKFRRRKGDSSGLSRRTHDCLCAPDSGIYPLLKMDETVGPLDKDTGVPKGAVEKLLTISIQRDGGVPLHKQVFEEIRRTILEGRLVSGAPLPSSRMLARELGLSRNTVLTAYDMLASEGYTDAAKGSATRVSAVLPESLQLADRTDAKSQAIKRRPKLSSLVERLPARHMRSSRNVPEITAFRYGVPELRHFPFNHWNRLLNRFWRHPPRDALLVGDPAGYAPLRRNIAAYLRAFRAVNCHEDQIIVTSGAQQGLTLACRVLLDPDDTIWLEEPGYPGLGQAVEGAGANSVGIPVDDEGLSVEAGLRIAPHARAVAVTPSHHYPLGITMSLARRLALLDWADKVDGWIIEDDYDSEFRYAGRPLSAMQGLDRSGRVIYVGTFSKIMFPTLRMGYLVVPPDLVDPFLRVRRAIDDHPPITAQPALAAFVDDGHFASHIRRMRALYGERQKILLTALEQHLAGALEFSPSEAGMHLCCGLHPALRARTTDTAIAEMARDLNVVTMPLSSFYSTTSGQPGLALGYAGFDEKQIALGAKRLAQAMDQM